MGSTRRTHSSLSLRLILIFMTVTLASTFSLTNSISSFLSSPSSSPSENHHLERSKRWASSASSQSPPSGLAKLIALDVICGKDSMTVRAEFNGPFNGIVFSKGTYGQDNCIYVKPHSSLTHSTFKVDYNSCGTKPDLQGKYYENTIVIQYGTDIIEAWDEAKRLRCEWFEAYEKPATFRPAIPVADLDVIEMNFQGDDIDCWMEIQEGKGPWAREVNRIVPVGQPMTIVVSINDYSGQFDMRVKSCFAHDGVKPPIHLTDEFGCVLRPKMLSAFNKLKDPNGKATVISYSHFYAFKFPDTMNVQIQCTVEVCRHGCPDSCQKGPYPTPVREIHPKVQLGMSSDPQSVPVPVSHTISTQSQTNSRPKEEEPKPVYQDVAASSPKHHVNLPGIHDQAILSHVSGFLTEQGVDVSRLGSSASSHHPQPTFNPDQYEESRPAPHYAALNDSQQNHQNHHQNFHESHDLGNQEEESKPVIKVVEIDVPQDKKQKPTITEQNSMFPQDLNQANKLLADLGLNVDLNSFANSLAKDPQQLSSFLQNDQVKQLASATGFNLNHLNSAASNLLPQNHPLLNFTNGLINQDAAASEAVETSATTVRVPVYEPDTEAPIAVISPQPSSHPSTQQPSQHYSTPKASSPSPNQQTTQHQGNHQGQPQGTQNKPQVHHVPQQQGHHLPPQYQPVHPHPNHLQPGHPQFQPHPQPQPQPAQHQHPGQFHHQGQNPHHRPNPNFRPPASSQGRVQGHQGHPGHQQQQMHHHNSQPVVQVMNIPMQPGLPSIQMPSSFTNLIHLPPTMNVPPPKAKRPLFHIPSFHLPSIPSLSSLNPFSAAFSHSKDRNDRPQPGQHHHHHMSESVLNGALRSGDSVFRSGRNRRSVKDPHIKVIKGFQVVTSMDLAFFPNSTTDSAPVFEGRREDVVYGICVPLAGFAASITLILLLVLGCLVFSAFMVSRISRRTRLGKKQEFPLTSPSGVKVPSPVPVASVATN